VHEVIATAEAVTGRPVTRRHTAAEHEPATLLADGTRIRPELGWRPEKSSLPEIISDGWTAEVQSTGVFRGPFAPGCPTGPLSVARCCLSRQMIRL
jgi:UDP-glucose 4-epimerase